MQVLSQSSRAHMFFCLLSGASTFTEGSCLCQSTGQWEMWKQSCVFQSFPDRANLDKSADFQLLDIWSDPVHISRVPCPRLRWPQAVSYKHILFLATEYLWLSITQHYYDNRQLTYLCSQSNKRIHSWGPSHMALMPKTYDILYIDPESFSFKQ